MHALITGGAGFIGAHLAAELASRGARVTLVDNMSRGVRGTFLTELSQRESVTVELADLNTREGTSTLPHDVTHVFHLAAILGVANVIERPYLTLTANVSMLASMLDYARDLKALERFVFPSTSEVYAGTQRSGQLKLPSPESADLIVSPLNEPRTSYMLSKIYGEAMCQNAGIPFTIVRPHNFFGPRMGLSHVIPQLLDRIRTTEDGEPLTVYSPEHMRTFCYIDDAVRYILALSLSEAGLDDTFNIGTQEPEITMADLAALLCTVSGRYPEITPGPTTEGSPSRRCPDMQKTIAATGMQPEYTLEAGVQATYAWYSDHVFSGSGISAR